MTITQPVPSAVMRIYDNSGNLAIGAKVYTYVAGTSTPVATYTDSTGTVQNTNPAVTNSRGEVSIWLRPEQAYKIVAYDDAGNLLFSKDQITAGTDYYATQLQQSLNGAAGAASIGTEQGSTVQEQLDTNSQKLIKVTMVTDFSGTDQQKFASAATAGPAFVPPGAYSLSEQQDGVFWSPSSDAVQDPARNADIIYLDKLETKNKTAGRAIQMIRANAYLMNNYGQGIVNIGDSISHGAYSGNLYTNHWTYLLARAIDAEFGSSKNIGEFPMEGLYNPIPALASEQLASVTFSGTDWGPLLSNPAPFNYPVGNYLSNVPNSLNGKTYSSTVNGATITLTFPTMGRVISFKYTRQPGGGAFNIVVNGTVVATVNTANSTTVYNVNTNNIPISDNGKGQCVVSIVKTDSNPVEINALYNLKTDSIDPTDLGNRMQFHNYAHSGRALYYMTKSAVIQACNSACLIVSLGYNDVSLGSDNVGTGDTIFSQFVQVIDWIIYYAKVYKTLIVVQDFCWYAGKHSRTRRQLKRLADAVNGIYIAYPDQFFNDSSQPTQPPAALQLNSPMYLWADTAHPNALGNEIIFSTLAKALGLNVTSKAIALKYHDWPFPLQITSSNLINSSPVYPNSLSSIQQCGDTYTIKVNMKPAGASLTQYAIEPAFTTLPAKFRVNPPTLMAKSTVAFSNYTTGAAQVFAIMESNSTLNIYTNQPGITSCMCEMQLPEIV